MAVAYTFTPSVNLLVIVPHELCRVSSCLHHLLSNLVHRPSTSPEAMAIFGNLMRKEQSTDPDPAVVHDAEKDLKTANIEDARASIGPGGAQHVVDPVLEKQLKRKMDWNLVPLVFVMCMSSISLGRMGP